MNTPVNFEIAKLLKEKGFNEMCRQFWGYDSTEEENILIGENSPTFINNRRNDDIAAPTIAEVVMWLYEKHGLWISVGIDTIFNKGKFCILLYKNRGLSLEHFPIENDKFSPYNSPKEAYEAAIEYTLTKLI